MAWVAAWVAVAVVVGIDVRRLGDLSTTLQAAGQALAQTGSALHTLSHLPFVGHDLASLARHISATATSAQTSAAASRSSSDQLSVLLPVVVLVVPVVPVLAVYLPVRVQRAREARALLASLRGATDLDRMERFLAERALANLPFHQLERLSPDPWADVDAGRVDALAAAELERLGVDPATALRPRRRGGARGVRPAAPATPAAATKTTDHPSDDATDASRSH